MLLTGHADLDAVIDAINKGQIYKYISKPWNEVQLADLIREAAQLHHQRRRERRAAGQLATLIDSARGINRELLELVRPGSMPDPAAWARIAELAERIEFTLSEQEL
jgi:FixJ family two-component response regulator